MLKHHDGRQDKLSKALENPVKNLNTITLPDMYMTHIYQPRRVLHITTSLATGGAEMMLLKLISASLNRNIEHYVVQVARDSGPIKDRLKELGIPLYSLGLDRGILDIGRLLRIRDILKEIKPDVVQGWLHHSNAIASLTKILGLHQGRILWGVRHTLYDDMPVNARTRLAIKICRCILRLSAKGWPAAIVYNSLVSAYQHERRGFPPALRVLIPNGFSELSTTQLPRTDEDHQSRDRSAHVFSMISRFHPMKGHELVLMALKVLVDEGINCRLVLAGRGCDEPDGLIIRLVKQLGLDRHVTVSGEVGSSSDLLANSDTLLVASRYGEGIPNIVGEAMLAACPVIATDVGDSRLLLGQLGIIIPRNDHSKLADAMRYMCSLTSQDREKLGKQLKQRLLTNFHIKGVAESFLRLYPA